MVSPFYLLGVGLGLGFLLGLTGKNSKKYTSAITFVAFAFFVFFSISWLIPFALKQVTETLIYTAGFLPPFSISLSVGFYEAVFSLMINSLGLLSILFLWKKINSESNALGGIILVLFMTLNMLVFARDIFNIFVWLEIAAISTSGIILLDKNKFSYSAGFKYLLASSIISSLYLIGVVLVYFTNGTLFLNDLITNASGVTMSVTAVFLMLIAIVLELKPFPANGWALDVYEGANPAIGAIMSGGVATASLFLLYKFSPLLDNKFSYLFVIAGLLTFVGSNLFGIKQDKANRLLGYSSIGQIGLLVAIIGFRPFLGDKFEFIAITILVSHFLAKAGLFWLSDVIKQDNIKNWSVLRRKPLLLVLFGIFVFSLIGLPPFPSFFGKWELIMMLSGGYKFAVVTIILVGSFIEAIYLFRWLGYAIKLDFSELPEYKFELNKIIPVVIFGALVLGAGYYAGNLICLKTLNYIPLAFIVLLYFIDSLPAYIKNTLSILALGYYSYLILPNLYETDMLRFIFAVIFLIGGIITLVAGYAYKGKRQGFYPVALLMYVGLALIIQAQTTLEFFFGWELMTAGSYFLIIRGKKSIEHGLSYILFSIGGAYAILAAFGLIYAETSDILLSSLSVATQNITLIFSLLAIGFMTKTASLGLHIWLPGAHAEAESDVSPMVSAILLKAGVFGLFILMIAMGHNPEAEQIGLILGWIGALTALVGNLAAAFQEDAKRLLAYSSISQLGYILFGLAMMTHLGWMSAMVYSINHFLYKSILFLTIGAVVLKVGTHDMYKMGGLIKNMPLAFIAVLIGIIALSGVPPLSGFAGKWLFYNAIIDKHWYFQGAIVFFSGIVAFLYLFKLIYSVFLGQLKDNLRKVKDISVWFAIPIYILIIGIMIISAKPELYLKPLGTMISGFYPNGELSWTGGLANAPYGYWNGSGVMITIGIMFSLLFLWLWSLSRKAQKVKQFNIVYAAEAPQRPETTHISYNIYAGYYKSIGWIVAPIFEKFWSTMTEWIHSVSDFGRRIYNGNGQYYMTHILIYMLAFYFILMH